MDLVLLAHQRHAGRIEFNEVLWELLTAVPLDPEYKDLSIFLSSPVGHVCRVMDRPPWTHRDRPKWAWRRYKTLSNKSFDPVRALGDNFTVAIGSGGLPLRPPGSGSPSHLQLAAIQLFLLLGVLLHLSLLLLEVHEDLLPTGASMIMSLQRTYEAPKNL